MLRTINNEELRQGLTVTNLGERSKAVGGAASIRNNVKLWLVFLLIDSYNKHGGILAGGRDDNLLSTTLHQLLRQILAKMNKG